MKQVILLSLWSFLVVAPYLFTKGTDTITWTYKESTERFWRGENPYAKPKHGDVYQYSPFFAAAYLPFAKLPDKLHALAWALLNCIVFWAGISAWFVVTRGMPWHRWVGLVFCSMEIDGSLRYQQVNALITGVTLLGLAAYRDGRLARAGSWLALGTNLKLLPLVFAGPLGFPPKWRYLAAAVGVTLVLFLLPVLGVGWERNWFLHVQQALSLSADLPTRKMLDIGAVLERLGWPALGAWVWRLLAVITAVLFALVRLRLWRQFPWHDWIAFGLLSLVLLSPRTESATFVMMAPAYLFLSEHLTRRTRIALVLGMFLTSLMYNSIWPSFLRLPLYSNYSAKTLGLVPLWALAAFGLISALRSVNSLSRASR